LGAEARRGMVSELTSDFRFGGDRLGPLCCAYIFGTHQGDAATNIIPSTVMMFLKCRRFAT
jgi:hypothetical protein